ncbi:2TM domain-containing protein [Mycobacteroides franklinii]|uniref:2TM domain-containing protein n=1 Tax=Mycobacteroides franklinii TaxID=948102 RepID=UPI0013E8D99E
MSAPENGTLPEQSDDAGARHRVVHLRRERYRTLRRWAREANRTTLLVHASVFLAVQILLVAIWALNWHFDHGTAYPWFVYPLLGWGIALVAHYVVANGGRRRLTQPNPTLDPPSQEPR